MTHPAADPDTLEILARQQETIDALTATVELHQRQIEALWRRIQDLEGIPLPDTEPPS
jgi:hypothetical protein